MTLALGAGLLAAVLALYADTAAAMVAVWSRSDTFAHGFLVGPIVLALLYRDRANLAAAPRAPWWPAHALAAGAGAVWLAAQLAGAPVVGQFALVSLMLAMLCAVFGRAWFARAAYPLMLSFFAVPAGEFLLPVLMNLTADFTVAAVRASGVPVYREGLRFTLPSGNWSVVEACSGLRYLIASLVAGAVFAYLHYTSLRRRVLFGLCALVVPLLANWLRAYLIVMLGHFSGNRLATGADHLVYGWVFFALVMAALFAIGARFREPPAPRVVPAGTLRPHASTARLARHALLACALVAGPPLWWAQREVVRVRPAVAVPAEIGGWRAESASPVWSPTFAREGAQAAWSREGVVQLAWQLFPQGGYFGRATSSEWVLVKTGDPLWVAQPAGDIDTAQGALARATVRGPAGALRVWHGVWAAGRLHASAPAAALALAWHQLNGQRGDAVRLAFYTTDDALADARLAAFIAQAGPAVARAFEQAR